jgi:hypothetical protein
VPLQPGGTARIALAVGVLAAIGFDGDAIREAGKIEYVGANRSLTAEFVPIQIAVAQHRPQTLFPSPTSGRGAYKTLPYFLIFPI